MLCPAAASHGPRDLGFYDFIANEIRLALPSVFTASIWARPWVESSLLQAASSLEEAAQHSLSLFFSSVSDHVSASVAAAAHVETVVLNVNIISNSLEDDVEELLMAGLDDTWSYLYPWQRLFVEINEVALTEDHMARLKKVSSIWCFPATVQRPCLTVLSC